ncbi:MAG: hypothetical protein Q8P20_11165 [bacterium]|nr:hypothetical protein [bacterium]
MAQYTYTTSSFSSSFGQIELCELTQEITGSSLITKELQYINRTGDTIYIYIEPTLSPTEESSLNDIIFYHSATASFCIPQEEFLTDGSRPLSGNLNINGYNIVNVNLIDNVDIDNHSSRHLSGGFDQIDGDKLDIDFIPSSYFPTTGSGLYSDSVENLSAHLEGIDVKFNQIDSNTIIWGQNFSQSRSNIIFSTTNINYQQAFTIPINILNNGTYRIGWNYIWKYDTSDNINIRIQIDDIDIIHFHSETPASTKLQSLPDSGFYYVEFISGSHYIDLDVLSTKSGKVATILSSSFEFWRVG